MAMESTSRLSDVRLPSSQDSEEDLPAFEYALRNGLSIDSQVNPFSILAVFGQSLAICTNAIEVDGLTSEASLPSLSIPSSSSSVMGMEPLHVTKLSVYLLEAACHREKDDDMVPSWPVKSSLPGRFKWKLEPPLVAEDPGFKVGTLARTIDRVRSVRLERIRLPRETFDVPYEEGIEFPEASYQFRKELARSLRSEKLDISQDALQHLKQSLCQNWTRAQLDGLIAWELKHKPFHRLCITPPLIPNDDLGEDFIPDAGTCQIELASEPPSLIEADLEAVEAQLRPLESLAENASPTNFLTPTMSPLTHLHPEYTVKRSLQLDEPLLPQSPDFSATKPWPDPGAILCSLRPNDASDKSVTTEDVNPEYIFSDELLETLQDSALMANRKIAQEPLNAADATARVSVPIMDFSVPAPSWQKLPRNHNAQMNALWPTTRGSDMTKWKSTKNDVPERTLNWTPLRPSLACPPSDETLNDDSFGERLMRDLNEGIPTSGNYVWKRPGLAILSTETEDEYEELEQEQTKAIGFESRVEMSDCSIGTQSPVAAPSPVQNLPSHSKRDRESTSTYEGASRFGQDGTPGLLLGCDDTPSTSTLLANFLNFRGPKRQRLTKSSLFSVNPESRTGSESDAGNSALAVNPQVKSADLPLQANMNKALYPVIGFEKKTTKIIKALSLSRGVFSSLEKLYPEAKIVERDFNRWNTPTWSPGSVTRSMVVSPLAAEADIIVSPATGILLTSLIQAIQTPARGKSMTPLRERIANTARRYQHLVVLVSEGALSPGIKAQITTVHQDEDPNNYEVARDMLPTESAALADFYGFVAGVGAMAYYVGGGEATVSRWVVGIIANHAEEATASGLNSLLIQDETMWEVFLRRAGLNAYAAQAILGLMKGDAGYDVDMIQLPGSGAAQPGGLARFVCMEPEERLRRFAGVMGGVDVLQRVNVALGWKWKTRG